MLNGKSILHVETKSLAWRHTQSLWSTNTMMNILARLKVILQLLIAQKYGLLRSITGPYFRKVHFGFIQVCVEDTKSLLRNY